MEIVWKVLVSVMMIIGEIIVKILHLCAEMGGLGIWRLIDVIVFLLGWGRFAKLILPLIYAQM